LTILPRRQQEQGLWKIYRVLANGFLPVARRHWRRPTPAEMAPFLAGPNNALSAKARSA